MSKETKMNRKQWREKLFPAGEAKIYLKDKKDLQNKTLQEVYKTSKIRKIKHIDKEGILLVEYKWSWYVHNLLSALGIEVDFTKQ